MPPIHWTPSLAYAVGLLTTDGSLSKDGRHIILSSSDLEQLENFKNIFHLTNTISQTFNNGYAKKPHYRIQFGNVKFYRWLQAQGLFALKTYTIAELRIPDRYFRDFIRGHLDGDGTIVIYEDRYNSYKDKTYINQRIFTKLVSVSEKHIRWLHEMIYELALIKGAVIKNPRKEKATMWELKFSKHASMQIFHWIYYKKSLPCLTRKRLLAEKAIKITAKT